MPNRGLALRSDLRVPKETLATRIKGSETKRCFFFIRKYELVSFEVKKDTKRSETNLHSFFAEFPANILASRVPTDNTASFLVCIAHKKDSN